ncbi:MAG: cyclic pyranopterin monophosphate synthase MoaC [Rickettsiales bacterium]|nr:cyclic pyranopterin monophosphate synthase MoaC [Rickettsiales bacterium]|tara:strand:- start:44011 stop:44490 length:480 start_codon:yes stop_codon:yes gene_type:complete
MNKFTHIKKKKISMVDISKKSKTIREAHSFGEVKFTNETFKIIKKKGSPKGELLSVSKIAAIQAVKRTSELIPLCHNLKIDNIDIEFEFSEKKQSILILSKVKTTENTGVEMEALTATSIAALTIYDMCKSLDKNISIKNISLKFKSGGKSGIYKNDKL